MTDKQIVEAAKASEKKTGFGKLVHSKISRGVNSAYGIGFIEGAEWLRAKMLEWAKEKKEWYEGTDFEQVYQSVINKINSL